MMLIWEQVYYVKLREIQMETQRGFFDYIFEDIDVFDRARELADAQFNSYKQEQASKSKTEMTKQTDRGVIV